jgi:hypothetical protein
MIETQRRNAAAIHMALARRNAELPCGRLDRPRPFWPLAGLIPQLQKRACQRGWPTQRRLSNKQSLVICANFERGLFKNAAHPPVDGVNPKSQN